jgi:hypothetical protein
VAPRAGGAGKLNDVPLIMRDYGTLLIMRNYGTFT